MERGRRILIVFTICFLIYEATAIYKNPRKCTKCPPGWGVAASCTSTEDTVCERCKEGRFYSSEFSHFSPCYTCSQCGVGLYEARRCSPIRDTVCNECAAYINDKNLRITDDFVHQCSYLFMEDYKNNTDILM